MAQYGYSVVFNDDFLGCWNIYLRPQMHLWMRCVVRSEIGDKLKAFLRREDKVQGVAPQEPRLEPKALANPRAFLSMRLAP